MLKGVIKMVSIENNGELSRQDILMISLTEFFQNKDYLKLFKKIQAGEMSISLRIIDWFVTNYSKKYNVSYLVERDGNPRNFVVYLEYKAQLKSYSKKLFDPFCRRDRILFYGNNKEEIITTTGQLNFFRWAIENRVLNYIANHLEDIEKDMNESLKEHYARKKTDSPNRREELSPNASKIVNKHKVNIVMTFD